MTSNRFNDVKVFISNASDQDISTAHNDVYSEEEDDLQVVLESDHSGPETPDDLVVSEDVALFQDFDLTSDNMLMQISEQFNQEPHTCYIPTDTEPPASYIPKKVSKSYGYITVAFEFVFPGFEVIVHKRFPWAAVSQQMLLFYAAELQKSYRRKVTNYIMDKIREFFDNSSWSDEKEVRLLKTIQTKSEDVKKLWGDMRGPPREKHGVKGNLKGNVQDEVEEIFQASPITEKSSDTYGN
ncbi:hypothetical protein BDK51DRAFT_28635 [Blyttiomyces helicus]|uniref:Uncharacterized protein n=1 Tax=Blyttiomyces helicus TaxID=388810 RepID=A0A4P9WL10_9FUNG|nr:hypothetical protein BDK51DRAFT_28635 [Blyttiomyces helicus]|eukprot:RKO92835.1 hypothetical protein BDK51DRAFT_28635 [Blyttiomyces helicus]